MRLLQRRDQRPAASCMCMTRLSDARRDDDGHTGADLPDHPGPGHRRVVQLREGPGGAGVRPAAAARPANTGWRRSTSSAARSSASASSASYARTSATSSATTRTTSQLRRAALLHPARRTGHASTGHPRPARAVARAGAGLGLCNITKCCTEVCPEHIKITDNAIIPMKERVVDKRYDPIGRLVHALRRRRSEG